MRSGTHDIRLFSIRKKGSNRQQYAPRPLTHLWDADACQRGAATGEVLPSLRDVGTRKPRASSTSFDEIRGRLVMIDEVWRLLVLPSPYHLFAKRGDIFRMLPTVPWKSTRISLGASNASIMDLKLSHPLGLISRAIGISCGRVGTVCVECWGFSVLWLV